MKPSSLLLVYSVVSRATNEGPRNAFPVKWHEISFRFSSFETKYIFFFNYRLRIYRKRDYTREKEFEFSTIDFVSKVQVGKVETVEN